MYTVQTCLIARTEYMDYVKFSNEICIRNQDLEALGSSCRTIELI